MSANHGPLHRIKAMAIPFLLVLVLIAVASASSAATPVQTEGAFNAGTLTEQNLYDLIAQMTVEEKDTFIHGSSTSQTPCADDYVSDWVYGWYCCRG